MYLAVPWALVNARPWVKKGEGLLQPTLVGRSNVGRLAQLLKSSVSHVRPGNSDLSIFTELS